MVGAAVYGIIFQAPLKVKMCPPNAIRSGETVPLIPALTDRPREGYGHTVT